MHVVLPAMTHVLQNTPLLGTVWRRTPGFVKRLLRWPARAALYILEHPWLSWIALVVLKAARLRSAVRRMNNDSGVVTRM